jgi:dihydrofolate synthase/folylpolyglutamate synthase
LKTYSEVLSWMYMQLPMYQRIGSSAYRPGLKKVNELSSYLKNPEQNFKSIHVAGTNGKGSTAHLLSSVLQEAGYNVGLYTSPHLLDFRERIKINGSKINRKDVIDFIKKNFKYFNKKKITFFEMTVAMAYDYFSSKKVDIAIIEVGMGGRLDATNIINPELSIITNIGLDHTQFLGNTHEKIAIEKAGIIKENTPVVIGDKENRTKDVFIKIAGKKKSSIIFASEMDFPLYTSGLDGLYQKKNIKTVQAALEILPFFKIKKKHIINGFNKVVSNTNILGRWQIIQKKPKVVLDVTHNLEGFKELIDQIHLEKFEKIYFVMGFVKERIIEDIFNILPTNDAYYYLSDLKIERSLPVEQIKKRLQYFTHDFFLSDSISESYSKVKSKAGQEDLILVCGSNFAVSEVLEVLSK